MSTMPATAPLTSPSSRVPFLESRLLLVLLLLAWAAAYLPQLTARDLRLEEGRRAEPAAEMLQSGHWITPRIYGEPYLNKPPLFFWIAAGMGKIQGRVTSWSIRFPSALSALLGAFLILAFAPRQLSRRARALGALIFLSMPIMLDKGRLGEIDAFLSLLTFASFVALWNFYDVDTGKIALWGWVLSGLAMALAALTKGPGGPIEFYAIFIPFLILCGRGRWKLLFSPGHFLMIAIALAPALVWTGLMVSHSNLQARSVGYQWADQLGLRSLFGTPAAFAGQKEPSAIPWSHYWRFPLDVVTMLLPWCLPAVFATLPSFARKVGWLGTEAAREDEPQKGKSRKIPRELWLLLAVSGPALIVVFWLYPMAFARHMMMIAYPVSVLVALAVCEPRSLPAWRNLRPFLRGAAAVVAVGLCLYSLGAIAVASKVSPTTLATTSMVGLAGFAFGVAAFRSVELTEVREAAIILACNVALFMLLGYGLSASIFLPVKAKTDVSRIFHEQIEKLVPANVPIYTTRTLLSGKGNDYYDIQFYLPEIPQAIDSVAQLPRKREVIAIIGPEEWAGLSARAPGAQVLGMLHAEKRPPPALFVVKVPALALGSSLPAGTVKNRAIMPPVSSSAAPADPAETTSKPGAPPRTPATAPLPARTD